MISFEDITSIGFTGTQKGMAGGRQIQAIIDLLRWCPQLQRVHHGDCVGADNEFDCLVRMYAESEHREHITVHVHPPTNNSKRAFCDVNRIVLANVVHEPRPYLDRNKDIVVAVDFLIAAPFEQDEQLRSGTWSTIRYARKIGKPHLVVYR